LPLYLVAEQHHVTKFVGAIQSLALQCGDQAVFLADGTGERRDRTLSLFCHSLIR
jgi:hypothetical protein